MNDIDKLKINMNYYIVGLYVNAINGNPLQPIIYHHTFEEFIDESKQNIHTPYNITGWLSRFPELSNQIK